MEKLDLHGLNYQEAELAVENFLYKVDLPAKIITGNSEPMKSIVKNLVDFYKLEFCRDSEWNLGYLVIVERRETK